MVNEDWVPPIELPDLSSAGVIAVDCETRDPNLKAMGPGTLRKDGEIVGVSIATDTGIRGYYPIRHEGGGNLDPQLVFRWLKDSLRSNQPKIGANLTYDLEWLGTEGIVCGGPKWDVQIAEPLIDENRATYKLDFLGKLYLNEGKDEATLKRGISQLGLNAEKESIVKGNLWRLHSKYVGQYGTVDADLPIRIFAEQRKILEREGLWKVFELESRMVDVMLAMRLKGIPVNIPKAEEAVTKMKTEELEVQKFLNSEAGFEVDVWAADDLEKICKAKGIAYNLTDKLNPSFEGDWLTAHTSPVMNAVGRIRKLDRGGSVFIQSKVIDCSINGRVHPLYRTVRDDDGGTRSGRLSSFNPNMQQVPARDKAIAKAVRSCFVAEPGCQWGTFDWSQQEPRVTVHYAHLQKYPGAADAVRRYTEDPTTDYHSWVAEMANIDRKLAKDMNLGLAYGMGMAKMSLKLGRTMAETKEIYQTYHGAVPFMKMLGNRCMEVAKERGYVKTILGRQRHYNLYGPPKWGKGIKVLSRKEALVEYGPPVIRYFCHNALNAIIQGSSADMLKLAMVTLYDLGYVMPLNVHDELDDPAIESEKQAREIRDVMIDVGRQLKLSVPLKVDAELGPSWGEAEEVTL